jgi:serine/threonine-protein kinase PknK
MTGRSGAQGTEQASNPNPPADAAESVPGYRELARIGHGGFSIVYRAVQESFERSVALKILTDAGADEDSRRRFLREVRLASRLSGHPHVVTVLDTGTTASGRLFLAMDLYEGGSMKARVKRTGPLSPAETAVVGAKIADALAAAHSLGVLHRDVKPNNILVSRFGEPALADFGVSCLLDSNASASILDVFSPQHAAPELMARGVPSASSDVYALGSTLYELLTGQSPFGGEGRDVRSIMWATMNDPAPRPDCPDLPGLSDAIVRALAKEPEDRFPDAAEFARTLRALIPEGTATTLAMPEVTRTVVMVDGLGADDAADLESGSGSGAGLRTGARSGSGSVSGSRSGSGSGSTGGSAAARALGTGPGTGLDPEFDPELESVPLPVPVPASDLTSTSRSRRVDETMVRPDRVDPDAAASGDDRGNGLRRARKPLVLLVSLGLLGAIGWLVYDSQGSSTQSSTDDASAHHVQITASAHASSSRSAARSATHSASPTPTSSETTAAAPETKSAASTDTSAASSATASASATSTSSSLLSGLNTYYRFHNAQSGDCLASPAAQSACASSASEGWAYSEPLTGLLGAVAGEYELVNKQSGDCLTAGSGGAVTAETCDSGTSQLWTTVPGADSANELHNVGDSLCLQASGGAVVDGTCGTSDDADLWSQDGTV